MKIIITTWRNGFDSYHRGEKRPGGVLMSQKGWDDAKFGWRSNGTHPKTDHSHYKGPGWYLNSEENKPGVTLRAVELGYAQ